MPYIPSEGELEQNRGGDFALMPEDLYVVEVIRHTTKDGLETPDTVMQPNPYNKTEEFPNGAPRPVLNVALKAISFSDGSPLVDENGDEPGRDVLFFAFLDTEKVGLKPRPSNYRKFITAAFGLKPEEPVNFDDWDELVGKRLIVSVKHKNGKHKVDDYMPVRRRRAAKAAAADDEPAAEGEQDMADKAKEIFGDEASF